MYTAKHWNFYFGGFIMECKLIFSWKMNSHNVILHIVHFFIYISCTTNIPQWYNWWLTRVKWQCNLLLNSNWLLCLSILQLFSWIGLLMIYQHQFMKLGVHVHPKQVGVPRVMITTLAIGISICLKAYALKAYAFGSVFLLKVVLNIRKGATSYQIYHNTPTFCM